jgi:hypothetical protein
MSANSRRWTIASALAAGMLLPAVCAEAQIGRLRRAAERVASGPSPEVRALLERIDTTRTLFDRATFLLFKSAGVMEAVVATQDRRAEIRRELASADSLEQRGGENRVQLNAEDKATRLEQAVAQRQYEQRQLSEAQSRNVSAAGFNAALAALMDAFALDQARNLIGEAQTAAQGIANDPAQLAFFNRLRQAATVDLPAIVNTVPTQVRLAGAIRGAVQQARAANQSVQATEATARSDPPRPIDLNAI